jgi:hypothetical protein
MEPGSVISGVVADRYDAATRHDTGRLFVHQRLGFFMCFLFCASFALTN